MNPVFAWAIRLMELLFLVGCVGSLVVILISGVEDVQTLLGAEHETERQAGK